VTVNKAQQQRSRKWTQQYQRQCRQQQQQQMLSWKMHPHLKQLLLVVLVQPLTAHHQQQQSMTWMSCMQHPAPSQHTTA
jgi:hypothetical protein